MRSKRGFTLIELLVVIAIIAILAAILFPVFAKARERARQAGCISNQKQIVIAAKMFADDWEGVLPYVGKYSNDWWWGTGWGDSDPAWNDADGPIYDYVKAGQEVFVCPAVRNQAAPSYSWNRHLSNLAEAMVQYPTTCPLIWDGRPGAKSAGGIPLDPDPDDPDNEDAWEHYPEGAGGQEALAASRHAGGLILGFLDGHAKFERPTSIPKGGRFQRCKDNRNAGYPQQDDAGIKISMYPMDPMRNAPP
jgi:prepilin-type N-terminal cleavage/methylation domain-containing protein/prepilin-type processing-associated H-X9-DG protein